MAKSDSGAFAKKTGLVATIGCAWLLSACGSTMLPIDRFQGDDLGGGGAAGFPFSSSAGRGGGSAAGAGGRPNATTMRELPVTTQPRVTQPPVGMNADAGPSPAGRPAPAMRDAGVPDRPDAESENPFCPGGVHEGSVVINSARDVVVLRGCKRVRGDLTITIVDSSELTGMESLEVVDGTLSIGTNFESSELVSPLKSLSGLQGLQRANELKMWGLSVSSLRELSDLRQVTSLSIGNLDQLSDLVGLDQLDWQFASIVENDKLRSLQGLKVPATADGVEIGQNPLLSDLGGFAALQSVNNLSLLQLPAVTDLKAFGGLREIRSSLVIGECAGLTDLSGIGAFKSASATIQLQRNAQLKSLNGLHLMGQALSLTVEDCPLLADLTGVYNPDVVSIGTIELRGLPKLASLQSLAGLTQLGTLNIERCDSLTNFTGLEMVTQLVTLSVSDCVGFQTMKGLDALDHVDGTLALGQVPALTSLQGAAKLTGVGMMLVSGAPKLHGLEGLETVTKVSALLLWSNAGLQSLHGLEALKQLDQLLLGENNALKDLTALAGLTTLREASISSNGSLESLSGLMLQSLDSLDLNMNPSLTSLTGLDKVTSKFSALNINGNTALTSLRALAASTGASTATIQDNRSLPQCEVDWLSAHWMTPIASMSNNPAGVCSP
jgi:internalin A